MTCAKERIKSVSIFVGGIKVDLCSIINGKADVALRTVSIVRDRRIITQIVEVYGFYRRSRL